MNVELSHVAGDAGGLRRLLEDVEEQKEQRIPKGNCPCAAAVLYKIGAEEAVRIYRLAGMIRIANSPCVLYSFPEFERDPEFLPKRDEALQHAERAHRLLEQAFEGYARDKSLRSQVAPIRRNVIGAFLRAKLAGFIAPAVAQYRYNHQGLVLLLLECCSQDEDILVTLLRQPEAVELAPDVESAYEAELQDVLMRPPSDRPMDATSDVPEELDDLYGQLSVLTAAPDVASPRSQARYAELLGRVRELEARELEQMQLAFERGHILDVAAADEHLRHAKELLRKHEGTSSSDPSSKG